MLKTLKSFFCFCLILLFFFIIFPAIARAQADNPPAPTLIAPNEKTATADLQPLVIGLTKSGSLVKVFIDGNYNGKTEILKHPSGTANFAYRPATALNRGPHNIYIVAEDEAGNLSQASEIFNFKIEMPMPAPTMFKPVINNNTTAARPFIVGLAKNDSLIKVYIDKKLSGEFLVKNHQSGTANFAYRPASALTRGSHQVYTVALDKRGKASIWSNAIDFQVKAAAIAQAAAEERNQAVASIKEAKDPEKTESDSAVISASNGEIEEKSAADSAAEVLSDLIGTSTAKKSVQGMVNEGKQNQAKLQASLVIFILFLVGVVGWLLWVNRELIKERRAQTEAAEKSAESGMATSEQEKSVDNQDKLL